ncbi:hypothetical protein AT251_22075 [Enterovibrio nigricans]|nr:hypothetical protein AT251_22075 [Enterovibrio nigricans]
MASQRISAITMKAVNRIAPRTDLEHLLNLRKLFQLAVKAAAATIRSLLLLMSLLRKLMAVTPLLYQKRKVTTATYCHFLIMGLIQIYRYAQSWQPIPCRRVS